MMLQTIKFDSKTVSGWCYDGSDSGYQPLVELRVDGELIAQQRADIALKDIYAETTSERQIGFSFELPVRLRDGRAHHIEICDGDSSVRETRIIEYPDSVIAAEADLFGEYRGFDRGMLFGWACRKEETTLPVITIDGEQVPTQQLPNSSNALRARHGFGALVPPKFYNGKRHKVELHVLGEDGQAHRLGEDIIAPNPDMHKLQRWRQQPKRHEDIIVASLEVTDADVILNLVGDVRNRRAILRLGQRRTELELVASPSLEGQRTRSMGQYAARLPDGVEFLPEYHLHRPGDALRRTYDIRLGDESGRRPSYLPREVTVSWNAGPKSRNELLPALDHWATELRNDGRSRLSWFSSMARETQSPEARDVLALAATGGDHGYESLLETLALRRRRTREMDTGEELDTKLWLPGLFALAQVVYSQRLHQQDFSDVYAIYDYAERTFGMDAFTNGVDRSYYADLLTHRGLADQSVDVLSYSEKNPARAYSQQFLKLNASNPHTPGNSEAQSAEWFSTISRLYREEGFAGLAAQAERAPDFYSLECEPVTPATDSSLPLVTVIMPIYEPDAATDVAIRSLLEQTWPNLEIIIIDDASPPLDEAGNPSPFRTQLRRWADQDQRITLVLCDENRGAYSVRNDAFSMANGEFVTVADKDDWHHPQRIEYQARDLMANPLKHANIVNWVRVDEQLKFQIRWGPDRVVHPSFACIMFRRREVLTKLGGWDPVRKSADNEYRKRFELVFGQKLTPAVKAPLAFSLLGEGNLTSSDFGLGYRHPDREVYQWAYTRWHDQIQKGRPARLNGAVREFYSPPSFRPEFRREDIPHFDVVYISEFGLLGGPSLAVQAEIETAAAAGLKVAIMPLRGGFSPTAAKRRLAPEIEVLWVNGTAEWITWNTEATAELAVICWPALMELKPGAPAGLKPAAVTIVANQLPTSLSSGVRHFSIRRVTRSVEKTFGAAPKWVAQSPAAEEMLRETLSPEDLLEGPWVAPAGAAAGGGQARAGGQGRAAIGRVLDEEERHWPDSDVIRDAYPDDPEFEILLVSKIRLLQDRGVVSEQGPPANWAIEPASLQPYEDYLRSLDFLVHYGNEVWDPLIEGTVVRALALGVVCVLHPALKPVYGSGALYAAPGEVRATLRELWHDAEQMECQRSRGREFLNSHRSPAQYLRKLRVKPQRAPE